MISRRETLKGLVLLAAAEKLTDGGLADVRRHAAPARACQVLPPGAAPADDFLRKCVGCGLCVRQCPEQAIVMEPDALGQLRPRLDFRTGFCRLACDYRCGRACPAGAIVRLPLVPRTRFHMGYATVRKGLCLRTTEGVACTACSRKCPARAISIVDGFPEVDISACVGCGACEHVCPSRNDAHEPAVVVVGYRRPRRSAPGEEERLVGRLREAVAAGKSFAAGRGDAVSKVGEGRGIKPILDALDADPQVFADAVVVDKIVGRAAAAIYVFGGAAKVVAPVMTAGARRFLQARGVMVEADTLVPELRNRKGDGRCPMESAVDKLDDPAAMVSALRAAVARMEREE